jgi:hypothetical protein
VPCIGEVKQIGPFLYHKYMNLLKKGNMLQLLLIIELKIQILVDQVMLYQSGTFNVQVA